MLNSNERAAQASFVGLVYNLTAAVFLNAKSIGTKIWMLTVPL